MLVLHRGHSANISSLFHTCRKQDLVVTACTLITFFGFICLSFFAFVLFFWWSCPNPVLNQSYLKKTCYDLKTVTTVMLSTSLRIKRFCGFSAGLQHFSLFGRAKIEANARKICEKKNARSKNVSKGRKSSRKRLPCKLVDSITFV